MDFPIGLTFNVSSPTQTVMVPILNDEDFSLVLMTNDSAVTLNPETADINIPDEIDSNYHTSAILFVACTAIQCFFSCFSGHNWIQYKNLFSA